MRLIKFKPERQLEALKKQRQRELNDDFVLCYIKANKPADCRSQSGFKPDYRYIIKNFTFENEELLRLVKKFKSEFRDTLHYRSDHKFPFEWWSLFYLVEHNALSLEDVATLLDNLMYGSANVDFVLKILAFLLDNDYKIKPEWVANAINDNALMERIKAKHTFTFDEIFEASNWNPYSHDDERNALCAKIRRHFPDSGQYAHFKCVQTNLVRDHLKNWYFYDREMDELSMVVGIDAIEREIPLGHCAEMMQKSLYELIASYEKATRDYEELNEHIENLFQRRDAVLNREALSANERCEMWKNLDEEIQSAALSARDQQEEIVSKLYFVISMRYAAQ